jgi:hypothetical protein
MCTLRCLHVRDGLVALLGALEICFCVATAEMTLRLPKFACGLNLRLKAVEPLAQL